MTITRFATPGGPIPVTVGTFETRRKARGAKSENNHKDGSFEAPKTTTATRIAAWGAPSLTLLALLRGLGWDTMGGVGGKEVGFPRPGILGDEPKLGHSSKTLNPPKPLNRVVEV